MKLYETFVVKLLSALLTESRRQTFLQSKTVRLLQQIAGNTEQPTRVPTSFRPTLSGEVNEIP